MTLGLPRTQAADADLDQIKAQLQAQIDAQMSAIKAKYDSRIEGLEKRIGTLESENARLEHEAGNHSTAAASPEITSLKKRVTELELTNQSSADEAAASTSRIVANADAIKAIELKLQADATETRDIYRDDSGWPFDIRKIYDLPQPIEFHGYMRSGFGMNGEGGKMEAFKAPGAGAKYRLGNESDTYGEIGLTFFNDRFSLALEAGVDWAKSDALGTDGHLWKITFAPQISRGGKFFSRPVLRAFVTYARWSDGFRGQVGGTAYENTLEGLSYGLQAEAWW